MAENVGFVPEIFEIYTFFVFTVMALHIGKCNANVGITS
jgi:hypothetical protein